jgi:hypothetical protein
MRRVEAGMVAPSWDLSLRVWVSRLCGGDDAEIVEVCWACSED